MTKTDWKQRYLEQLDASERQEQAWREERHSLQRLLVRATLAAEGQDATLDQILERVREVARADEPDMKELRSLQERLDQLVTDFDDRRGEAVAQLRGALQKLVKQLSEHTDRQGRRALRDFEKDNAQRIVHYTGLPAVLEQLSALQAQVLEADGQRGKQTAGSFWRRLLGREGDNSVPCSNDAVESGAERQNENPGVEQDVQRLDLASEKSLDLDEGAALERSDAVSDVGARLAELVRQLQSQLTLPRRVEENARELEERARQSAQWSHVRGILDEVAQLVFSAVGHGQREFESFLSGLDERLTGIKSQFGSGALDLGNWESLSEHYDRQLHQEIEAMDREALEAEELETVRRAVRAHVDRLNGTLEEYREAGGERERRLREQVVELQDKVTALEERSREVQAELQRERQRATTDMLTQLPNREALEERLQQELERWERYRQPVSLAILDIDRFKDLNDTYGHLAGDKVLQLLARALRENLRQPDFIARYGGEEFVVLFPETEPESAKQVMEKLREQVRRLPFHFRQERVEVTFSAGVVGFGEELDTFSLLDVADRALYRAKEAGRNRTLLAEAVDYRPKGPVK